jgi:hypothetical protein
MLRAIDSRDEHVRPIVLCEKLATLPLVPDTEDQRCLSFNSCGAEHLRPHKASSFFKDQFLHNSALHPLLNNPFISPRPYQDTSSYFLDLYRSRGKRRKRLSCAHALDSCLDLPNGASPTAVLQPHNMSPQCIRQHAARCILLMGQLSNTPVHCQFSPPSLKTDRLHL